MASVGERWSLKGKTALVTGGTRGIGRAIVEELAELGASVYTCGRSEKDLVERLSEWRQSGFNVEGSVCDLSKREERETLMKSVAHHFSGKLNILVNNVGSSVFKSALDTTAEDMSFMISTNFESAFHTSQLAHPLLKASGNNSSVIFLTSIAGSVHVPLTTIYSATKGAMNQLTRNLACEWADDGIRVNSVAPGYTRTELAAKVLTPEHEAIVQNRTPAKRVAEPREIAAVVAFLGLPCSSYLIGQVITVDGGLTIHGISIPSA